MLLRVRNVEEALSRALWYMDHEGSTIRSASRNGPVRMNDGPVMTTYLQPQERIILTPERDYNVAFCLYEALWMLAGRSDVQPLTRYVSTFAQYSDDGRLLHGAYGDRWRKRFGIDQLSILAERLRKDPTDRRCVLQIWDGILDLDVASRDIPCNVTASFQVSPDTNVLDMTVFCRSNDVIWGAYFANAFHFSLLLEYVAIRAGLISGRYTQVSVNWHAYEKVLAQYTSFPRTAPEQTYRSVYEKGEVFTPVIVRDAQLFDEQMGMLLDYADSETLADLPCILRGMWWRDAYAVLRAHEVYRHTKDAEKALTCLESSAWNCDMIYSMRQWLTRRIKK